jgi:hypothetical protein
MRFQPDLLSKAILAASFAVVFAGCGGSGGGSDDPAPVVPETHVLSGTAASGAPIIGQVTIKDATGTLRAVDIEANGHYSVDVSDLTAPFLLRAAGEVGGRRVTLLSAATSADLDGTINITPFTDLIVANIAGQVATAYFESGNFSTLSTEQLNAAKTTLTQRLQPILTSMGISDSFDLLRTSFNADRSGFDAVMDVVSVTVDEETGVAQIRDLINNTEISDDLADDSDATELPTPVIGLVGVAGNLAAIDAVLAALQAQLATSLPDPDSPTLRALFVSDGSFLDAGQDLDTFLHDVTSDDEAIGITFSGVSILERIDDTTLRIGLQFTKADGSDSDTGDWIMKKVDGVWKIAGDQRSVGTDVGAVNARNVSGSFGWLDTGSQYSRYLELYVDYAPVDVEYIVVTGPGLTSTRENNAVILHRSTEFEGFSIVNSDDSEGSGSWLSECGTLQHQPLAPCVDFSTVGLNELYTFTPLDSNSAAIAGKPAFTRILPAPPLSNALAETNAVRLFGSVVAVIPADYTSFTDGTTITVTVDLPAEGGSVLNSVQYSSESTFIESRSLNADGVSVDLTWEGAAPVYAPSLNIWMSGDLGRAFVTLGRHN